MKSPSSKLQVFILLSVLAFTGIMAGCSEDPSSPPKQSPPALPPSESLRFDLSFFDMNPGAAAGERRVAPLSTADGQTMLNWTNAALRVAFINTFITAAFTPPVLVFQTAIHTQPVLQEDGSFLWTYVWTDPRTGHKVTIHLTGRIDGVTVHWALRVDDSQVPYHDFLWFYGDSRIGRDEGFWVFNDLVDFEEVESSRIDWIVHAPLDRTLTFENIREGDPGNGDRLTYRVDGVIMSLQFHDASAAVDSDITWNVQTRAGSLQVPDYNQGRRACWDASLQDVECLGAR